LLWFNFPSPTPIQILTPSHFSKTMSIAMKTLPSKITPTIAVSINVRPRTI
jgi:hypothetical protein